MSAEPFTPPGPGAQAPELEAFRDEIPLVASIVYLANCSQGPLSRPVREAIETFLATWAEMGMHWDEWVEEVEQARAAFADLIGAAPEDVAIGTSESQLASSLVSALVARERDGGTRRGIVSSTLEFPGVGHAWLGATPWGWTVDWVERTVEDALVAEDFVPLISDSTALVSVPHVVYANGAMVDPGPVVEAAHARGALVYLDAYQSVGTQPIDVASLGVDVLAAGALKYLMGTAGIAFMYMSPAIRDGLEPTVTGWFGRVDPFAFDATTLDYPEAASRFDLGTPPLANAYAARAGIDLVARIGPAAIRGQIERLSAVALDVAGELGLRVLGAQRVESKGPTTAIDAGTAERALAAGEALRARSVVVAARGRAVRLAPHGFNREDELDHALRELADVFRELGPA